MKPYYQDGTVTLYHGDCREILPEVVGVDLLLADPPYGMNHEPLRRGSGSKRWGAERVVGDQRAFDPSHLLQYPAVILWGANWYASRLPDSGGWLVWDKQDRRAPSEFTASDAELAWTNTGGLVRTFRLQWGGNARNGEPPLHPTQKPVALMEWCIRRHPDARLVLDPYAGSGPVLVAAKNLGRRGIGVEIEERYCEIAARRLSQEVLDLGVA
jgi:site-specific DNA-methyltransferase (adenine-specific)